MPVKKKTTQLWPNSRIPYTLNPAIQGPHKDKIVKAIQDLNKHVNFMLFTEKEQTDHHYAEFLIGEQSESPIGCQEDGPQQIRIKSIKSEDPMDPATVSEHTILHEMCHCIGLEHEHFHPDYPFGENVDDLRQEIKDSKILPFPDSQVPRIIETRKKCEKVGNTNCDFNSVMMYGNWGKIEFGNDKFGKKFQKYASEVEDHLSKDDVAAIKSLYRPPPPPPPCNITIHLTSSFPHDSLRMTFEMRSRLDTARISTYKTDASGKVLVRGFNPSQVEMRVPGYGTHWTSIAKGQPVLLRGARYIYKFTW